MKLEEFPFLKRQERDVFGKHVRSIDVPRKENLCLTCFCYSNAELPDRHCIRPLFVPRKHVVHIEAIKRSLISHEGPKYRHNRFENGQDNQDCENVSDHKDRQFFAAQGDLVFRFVERVLMKGQAA